LVGRYGSIDWLCVGPALIRHMLCRPARDSRQWSVAHCSEAPASL